MLENLIMANAAPIVENRIKEILTGVAKEHNLDPLDLRVMFKLVRGNIIIYAFKDRKKVTEIPLSAVKGNIGNMVENKMKSIFEQDALRYNIQSVFVNYYMKMRADGTIHVFPYISGEYKQEMTIKQLLT